MKLPVLTTLLLVAGISMTGCATLTTEGAAQDAAQIYSDGQAVESNGNRVVGEYGVLAIGAESAGDKQLAAVLISQGTQSQARDLQMAGKLKTVGEYMIDEVIKDISGEKKD